MSAPSLVLSGGITASGEPLGPNGWWATLGERLGWARRFTVHSPPLPEQGPRGGVEVLADAVEAWLEARGAGPVVFVGASLGGLVGQALAIRHPARVTRLVAISAGLRPDPWATAARALQRRLVRQGHASLARQLGLLTYRAREEFAARFAPLAPDRDEAEVASYLAHHGDRFARSFPAERYLALSERIDRTDLRVGLGRVTARVDVVGVPQDLLFPLALQQEQVAALRAEGVDARLHLLHAPTGHDAFLTHQDALATLLHREGL